MACNTLSIAVPAGCPNNCVFCISKMYERTHSQDKRPSKQSYVDRMSYARDRGCDTLMLTGDGEPTMNMSFLKFIADCNHALQNPFSRIEIQSSGAGVGEEQLAVLRVRVGVSVFAFSLTDFHMIRNSYYTRSSTLDMHVAPEWLSQTVLKTGLTLRLCFNLMAYLSYLDNPGEYIFQGAKRLGVDQLILRVIHSKDDRLRKHVCSEYTLLRIRDYVAKCGKPLEKLPSGKVRYSVDSISTVIDEDCMALRSDAPPRYFILREDGKLYTRWEDKGSIIF